jgi:hypothetical protein
VHEVPLNQESKTEDTLFFVLQSVSLAKTVNMNAPPLWKGILENICPVKKMLILCFYALCKGWEGCAFASSVLMFHFQNYFMDFRHILYRRSTVNIVGFFFLFHVGPLEPLLCIIF